MTGGLFSGLVIFNIQVSDAGQYVLVATNLAGSNTNQPVTVSIAPTAVQLDDV